MSHTDRSDRPMRRWISWVRPEGLPSLTSRRTRSGEDPGSIEYSAVTQPLPLPFIQRGTRSSIDAVHSTRVRPKLTSTDPAAVSVKSRSKVIGRQLVVLSAVVAHRCLAGVGDRFTLIGDASTTPPGGRCFVPESDAPAPVRLTSPWPLPPLRSS